MPELPEVANLARQMDRELRGRRVAEVDVVQPRCLNVPPEEFGRMLAHTQVNRVTSRGKWIFMDLEPGATFLLNLGMGGEVLFHHKDEPLPGNRQSAVLFEDGGAFSQHFCWFGYVHAVKTVELASHTMTAALGLDPLDDGEFTLNAFEKVLVEKKRSAIKTVLMDQKNIAGIGNVYIQDILFAAGLHPLRKTADVTASERRALYAAICSQLRHALELGGLAYEKDLYGQPGRFTEFLVGYREGKPCPTCGALVQKIRTGSTASFICPTCQT
ncbi:Fpg/Nei family DNA glycosylase [Candidatus Cryosericum septentrionale]|jgi:formamidopyrimidine-DNA glycosylase|uniref:Fpg/Nei family DNA glycosylase n=1 Tax=Candidatus Cryosericum septentrionale TaxID=2290913 RepID=A0A398DPD2_9BACT|nr:DNA-formamidopyrimidine glycosylase family protein [Candidatus Cryosericum septentrionale]RIE17492.1 Fpg/Nei family DNA glycosylase [Candidatus Cryosericum septentrionale]